jgi:Uri superfamily endonuclease
MINDCGSDQRELFKKIERMFNRSVEKKENIHHHVTHLNNLQIILQTFLKIKLMSLETIYQHILLM